MHESAPTRRLLIVDPCDDLHALTPVLHAAGWTVHSSPLESSLDMACDVGVIRLMPVHFEHSEMVRDLISRTDAQWIAVLTPDDLRREKIGDFVCEWFFDFHTLPFDVARMQVTLGRAYGMARLCTGGATHTPGGDHEMLGESRPVRELRRLLSKLAPTESPVLIRGERGTGKELVARTLHLQSQRRNKPFVAVNCSSIAEHLIHAELFGYEKGAFNGAQERRIGRIEAANGGTLFLDEIGDLPLEVQAHLLRFIQERQIDRIGGTEPIVMDVRVLAATHVDLESAIRKKRFREDLYYLLNVLQVGTAPLRERLGDLAMLANHFAHFFSQETGRRARNFSQDALIAMGKHDWPGNVRELANRVRRGLVLAEGRQIEAADLGLLGEEDVAGAMGTLDDYKSRAERQALCDVLTRHSDNLSVAARVLGISRPTFYRLLHKHQIR
ncbi:sigma-54-dependent Fis family transcriptional regulator [Pseudomonas sp. CDFA 602]|uniref:sigma-54 dependent transcriptional regulator n=1 Tax=Pseudomonas californiensis TaxID=2829823 RepID=UPI001E525BF6|nr:sigma-54 dependent transcriptional regulator [Pseudomonas californiensis]MCD5994892.1 sigma-54-dependent Fis family transcriptional regulator [Pseudomonas californiensis]MCD6000477.1 sigma-54-dependent Fis family transcriptional regulator [Pseudomonas californiensis]